MAKKKSSTRKKENLGSKHNDINVKEKDVAENKAESEKSKSKKKSDQSKEEGLNQKVDELNDKFLRLYSEFDNYRKRTVRERIEYSKTASEEVIAELLPVIDDFERAIKSTDESEDCTAVKEGVILIMNKFKGILEKKGLKPIEAIGGEFDTDFHEAITYIPAPSKDLKGKIVDEIEKGYMLHDKVIRYTKVVIGQ